MKKYLLLFMVISAVFPINAQVESWDPDWDGDNNVGVSDLLGLLSVFGDYDLDNDGIWDSVDDCVGEYDECGVCNGAGILEGFCSCDGLTLDALGVCGGDCLEDYDGDGICDEWEDPCSGIDVVYFQGDGYEVVAIGDQCWFAENLKTTTYRNGQIIPSPTPLAWSTAEYGAQRVLYYADGNYEENFGRVYNWFAVDDLRGICPSGWHVPSEAEFDTLIDELGGEAVAGVAAKNSSEDSPPWNGTNSSGFSAAFGGWHDYQGGNGYGQGIRTSFWTSTFVQQNAYNPYSLAHHKKLTWEDPFTSHNDYVSFGRHVRCLKDTE